MFTYTKKFRLQILLTLICLPWCFLTAAAQDISSEAVTIAAGGRGNPFVNFADGKLLAGDVGDLTAKGAVAPLALASADFDADGTADLATAYKTANGGLISIRRGNVESVFPVNSESSPAPFFAETQDFELSFAPDFFAAGDFNADGKPDLLAAMRGTNRLVLLAGNGTVNFSAPQAIELPGKITAFAVGEINSFDNLPDVAVGVLEKGAAKILIFQVPCGAFSDEPQIVEVKKAISALAFGELDGDASRDLVAAAGDELVFVRGSIGGKIKNENVAHRKVDFNITDLAIGDFTGESKNEIAVLSQDGEIFINKLTGAQASLLAISSQGDKKVFALSRLIQAGRLRSSRLLAAKISTRQKADLIVSGANALNFVTSDGADNFTLAATFDAMENPIAVLPMRLNKDALNDLVILTENKLEPTILLTAPTMIRTVSSSSDGGSGSLRDAIEAANANPGLDEIRFAVSNPNSPIIAQTDLPEITDATTLDATTQNGYHDQPLIEIGSAFESSGSGNTPMVRLTAANCVLRGFIVKRASANANIIRIDGDNNFIEGNFIGTNRAGTASNGAARNGIAIFSTGNSIGGATAQARNVISGISGTNANGVSISGGGNFVKGNYIGTDKNGLSALGNGGSGILVRTAANGNVIGGATDGERNIISGNTLNGINVTPASGDFSDVLIENNYIGTNKTGDAALGNLGGVRLEYTALGNPTATAKVFDNVISGNTGDGFYGINPPRHAELNIAPDGVISDGLILGRRCSHPFADAPDAVISGNSIGLNAAGTAALPNTGNGVRLENLPSQIEGNTISANGASGIRINGTASYLIADNFIGTNAAGTAALGNQDGGIWLNAVAQTTKILDNLVSGNTGDGIRADYCGSFSESNPLSPTALSALIISTARQPNLTAVAPFGNRIGLNSDGTAALPNTGNGIRLENSSSEISYNTISANGASGVRITGATSNLIADNFIGTNSAGDAALPNTGYGINLQNVGAKIDGNVISSNAIGGLSSVLLSARAASQITNNFIGTDASGNNALGNGSNGIKLEFQSALPMTEIYDNVISGNTGDGIRAVNTSTSSESAVQSPTALSVLIISSVRPQNAAKVAPIGNRIGLNANGTAGLGNSGNGIFISNVLTKIGGVTSAEGNQIAYNGAKGIVIAGGAGNLIRSNAIFSNARIAIDLGNDGLTPNDLGDADTGANNLQNFPVLASALSSGASTTVSGTINTTPNTALNIQFYVASNGATSGGNPLGTLALTSNASGNASFSTMFPTAVSSGSFVSATATTSDTNDGNANNTSEFSSGVAVFAPTASSVTVAGRVLTTQGSGVERATISLTNQSGSTRTALTNKFGYYRSTEVPVGETYVLQVRAKRFQFVPDTMVLSLTEEITNLNFTAINSPDSGSINF